MLKKESAGNVEFLERRKHWIDRRSQAERRNPVRVHTAEADCRSGQQRRRADVSGELADGEIWWQKIAAKNE